MNIHFIQIHNYIYMLRFYFLSFREKCKLNTLRISVNVPVSNFVNNIP